MDNILVFAKKLIVSAINENSIVVDATMGNGNDTLFLLENIPHGHVYAFDVQEEALINTKQRLIENDKNNFTLIHDSHEYVRNYVDQIDAAIFNLGYLPGADKSVTTKTESTLKAVNEMLDILTLKGIIVIVIYPGHEAGKEEEEILLDFGHNLDRFKFNVLTYRLINKNKAPFIMAIEKIK